MVSDLHKKLIKKIATGFTLIEIMIVITVVGVIGTATITRLQSQQERSRNVARKTMVNQLASAITTFYSTNRYWPSSLDSLKPHYVSTLPVDPKGLSACNNAVTSDGKYGYATYVNGGENGEKNGFMVFAQVEHGGQGLDYGNIYILTGSSPCQDTALASSGKVDWFRVANARCTSQPGWTDNNTPFIAFRPNVLQQLVINLANPSLVYAAKPVDNDGDGYKSNKDPDDNDPCNPKTFNSNCEFDTDGDGILDWVEGESADTDQPSGDGKKNYTERNDNDVDLDGVSDQEDGDDIDPCIPDQFSSACSSSNTDGVQGNDNNEGDNTDTDNDGIPDYIESNQVDTDNDGIPDQYDDDAPYCNGERANLYVASIGGTLYLVDVPSATITAYDGSIYAGNGKDVIVGSAGNDIIYGGNGADVVCAGDGNDIIAGDNSSDVIHCGGGTDTVEPRPNGNGGMDACSTTCEITEGCSSTVSNMTGITSAPSQNTTTCSQVTASASDADGDSYVVANGIQATYGNADIDDTNPCVPNIMTWACRQRPNPPALLPGGTCFDNDNDGHRNNVVHILPNNGSWDPQDQDPCSPDSSSQACIDNSDNDNDGYKNIDDPAPEDPCIPEAFRSGCDRDSDGDGDSDFNETEDADSDVFIRFENNRAHDRYQSQYAIMINSGGAIEIIGDGTPDYLESDEVDSDGDGIDDEHDPMGTGTWRYCIPSNFGSGCVLDYDNDGFADSHPNEGEDNDGDSDGYPNRLESLITNGLSVFGLNYPEGRGGDPDADGYPNQIDPANENPCIPDDSTQACLDYIPSEEVYTGYVLSGINCSAIKTLPYGSRAFYIWMY